MIRGGSNDNTGNSINLFYEKVNFFFQELGSIDTCGIKVVGGSETEKCGIVRCGKVDIWDVWKVRAL